MITPLEIEIQKFDAASFLRAKSSEGADEADTHRNNIISRLEIVKKNAPNKQDTCLAENVETAVTFILQLENPVLLATIDAIFSRTLKYNQSLLEGTEIIRKAIDVSAAQFQFLSQIDQSHLLPKEQIEDRFQISLHKKQGELRDKLRQAQHDFQTRTHPGDTVFADIFNKAIQPIEAIIAPLAWYKILQPIEHDYLKLIDNIKKILTGSSQTATRLKQDISAQNIIKQLIRTEAGGTFWLAKY